MGDGSPWDTCPLEGHRNDFLFPHAPRGEGRGEGIGSGERPPFWKLPAGAGSRAGREARRDIRARRVPSVVGGVEVGWRSESGEFVEPAARGERVWVVRWSLQSVESPGVAKETRAGGAALPAVSRKLALSCGESRRELAGRLARPELNRGYASCRGDGTSRLTPQGTSRVQVTCTVSRDSFGLPSPTP